MFRPAARQLLKTSVPRSLSKTVQSQRFISTAPPHQKSRSWKSSALRWATAGALVYTYNTSNVFADEPAPAVHAPPETGHESETLPTLDQIAAQRQSQKQATTASSNTKVSSKTVADSEASAPGSPEELEEEAGQQGAFNEETGEINWECPCLGGMAHGPCGEEFREAFSCFVYSKEEPKGVDCIDKFKGMQECFRLHPDIYGAELDDEEEGQSSPGDAASPSATEGSSPEGSSPPSLANIGSDHGEKVADVKPHHESDSPAVIKAKKESAVAAKEQVKADHGEQTSESDHVVPKAAHDAR